jgi:hypothetical protein
LLRFFARKSLDLVNRAAIAIARSSVATISPMEPSTGNQRMPPSPIQHLTQQYSIVAVRRNWFLLGSFCRAWPSGGKIAIKGATMDHSILMRGAPLAASVVHDGEIKAELPLKDMQQEGRVKCLGRGPGAQWERKEGITPKRG